MDNTKQAMLVIDSLSGQYVTKQAVHVINSLSGQPAWLVAEITKLLPDLIQAVEESGWIKIDDDNQPPNDVLVRIWNESFKQEMTGKYIHRFSLCTEDVLFEGDADYNEDDDRYYHPEGWYVFCEHVGMDYVYGHCLDEITHYKPLVAPAFLGEGS